MDSEMAGDLSQRAGNSAVGFSDRAVSIGGGFSDLRQTPGRA